MHEVLVHEKMHADQLHSFDLLLIGFLSILQWFNPFAWFYKTLVKENHEFLADEAVINHGYSPDAYRFRIVAQLFGIRSMPTANNFNHSITKKRLKMIAKNKSSSLALPSSLITFSTCCPASKRLLSNSRKFRSLSEICLNAGLEIQA